MEIGMGGTAGTSGGGRVGAVDMDEVFEEREPADNRFSDLREGVRGKEENRFKLAPRVVRRRVGDEGVASSPISFTTLGGERVLERRKRFRGIWESADIAIPSSEGGECARGASSTMILNLPSSFFLYPCPLRASGWSITAGGGAFASVSPTSLVVLFTSVTSSSIDGPCRLRVTGEASVDGGKAPSRTCSGSMEVAMIVVVGSNFSLVADIGRDLDLSRGISIWTEKRETANRIHT